VSDPASGGGGRLLQTSRIVLRPWSDDDVDAFQDIYSRWEVARWLGPQPRTAVTSAAEARTRLGSWRRRSLEVRPPLGLWAIVPRSSSGATGATERPVGTALLLPLGEATDEVEIGWHLHPDHQHRGLATHAARALLDAARAVGIVRVTALTDRENPASAAVAGRLGMRDEGETDRWFGLTLRQFAIDLD
jgi:RimJ/RimL family protein N-acetyltransferase